MRVLHLTTEFPPIIYGGLGTAVGGLVAASVLAGIDVAVLLVGSAGRSGYLEPLCSDEPSHEPRPGSTRVVQVPYAGAEEAALGFVQSWRPDVLHLHVFWLWSLARTLRVQTGIPLVYTVHSLDRAEYELGQGPPECLHQWDVQADLIRSADRVVVLTRAEQDLVGEYCPAAASRVRVVGNGIADTPNARAAMTRRRTRDTQVILFSGRFVERKGVRDLIEAIPLVLSRTRAVRFVLAGGHRHCSAAEMAHCWWPRDFAPYRQHVEFTGWLDANELAERYAAADVLVVPSWYEPFGMVVLEGMLYGLAIAASAVGGPREMLVHERTGLLFPPRNSAALASAVLRLILDDALRMELGRAAAQEVRAEWLYSRVVHRTRAVYSEIAGSMSVRLIPFAAAIRAHA